MKKITRYRDLENYLAEHVKCQLVEKNNYNSDELIQNAIETYEKEINFNALDILANDSEMHKKSVAALLVENHLDDKSTILDITKMIIVKRLNEDLDKVITQYFEDLY